MNVKQLRNLLLDYPDHLEVVLASDPEGNSYHRLIEVGYFPLAGYHPEGLWDFVEPRLVLWP